MNTQIPWLTLAVLVPMGAALLFPFLPGKSARVARWVALSVALLDFAILVTGLWLGYDPQVTGYQLVEQWAWWPQMGWQWALAVDGLSLPLLVLGALVTTLAIAAAWRVQHRPRLFYALMLLLYGAQLGVFAAKDVLLFFLMWELELVPVYLLIAIWGGPQRQYAATKFILYTALGSVLILVGGLALANAAGSWDMGVLAQYPWPLGLSIAVYLMFFVAFGVKLPVFPLHTWLPFAHSEASAPVSMVLAGVLLKLGGYGLLRLNVQILPAAHQVLAPMLVVLGVINILYGALTAYSQDHLKKRLAYSSISHMGFVLVGLGAFNAWGLQGALLQMVSHGFIAAALFFLAGITYERTHTLAMAELGGLASAAPRVFALFTTASFASLALPGMSGFISELSVFLGLADSLYNVLFKALVLGLTAVGVILTPIYLLDALRRVFYGTTGAATWSGGDANPRELFIALSLLVPVLLVGLYPRSISDWFNPATTQLAQLGARPLMVQRVVTVDVPTPLLSTMHP
ncbi:MAG: NAD(P)H-quinone oxidoreductase subunit 4 [Gloeomargarita sp. SKYG116]|nr:NAD(P)H-quinone oxidoreductase subunit 4 [Gloeomargarita sp. SKYG116]MDW8402240.1 NAD(P)H-quinone oxidoreductase subunit 4 [Gloeomargarita sp. SKYGB_i_bin116]